MVWTALQRGFLPTSAILVAAVACLPDSPRCGAGSAPCLPPPSGFAIVQGSVINAQGQGISSRQVYVTCPVAGAYDQHTKGDGTFRITLVYETYQSPPPLDPDGMFRLSCTAVVIQGVARDTFSVPFAPALEDVQPVTVTLREPS